MPKPQLDGTQIDAGPKASRGKGRAEFVKVEVLFIELRTVGNGLQAVEEVEFRVASSWLTPAFHR
jgi:hypothetical protein